VPNNTNLSSDKVILLLQYEHFVMCYFFLSMINPHTHTIFKCFHSFCKANFGLISIIKIINNIPIIDNELKRIHNPNNSIVFIFSPPLLLIHVLRLEHILDNF